MVRQYRAASIRGAARTASSASEGNGAIGDYEDYRVSHVCPGPLLLEDRVRETDPTSAKAYALAVLLFLPVLRR